MKGKLFLVISACILYTSCGTNDEINAEAIEDNETTPENPLPSGPKGTPNFAQDTVFNFGKILDGERVSHDFVFTNTGEGDLIISNVQASCGCTTPDWTKDPIKPGEKGTVKAEFNSSGRGTPEAVVHEKSITVDFSNSTVPLAVLKFRAKILSKK